MPYVVRKFHRPRWLERALAGDLPSADAVTKCLITTRNTLSVWAISDPSEIEEAVLAMASNFTGLDTIDILIMETASLKDKGLKFEDNDGETHYTDYANKHRDIIDLNSQSLSTVAESINETIKDSGNHRFTLPRLKAILQKGIEDGKIQADDLNESVRNKLDLSGENS